MDTALTKIIEGVIAFVCGGGMVALLNHLNNKRHYELVAGQTNIETAIRLKDEAVKEYNTAEQKLARARALLDEVQAELDHAKKYIDVLQDILKENKIKFPEYDSVAGDKDNG